MGIEIDPELAALPEVMEIEAATNGASSAASSTASRQGPRQQRKHTRPRARVGIAAQVAAAQPAAPHAEGEVVRPVAQASRDDGTKSALIVWPNILEEQRQLGVEPSAIGIRVQRIPTGPQKQQAIELNPIDGGLVCGTESQGPAEALYDWILNFYHVGFSGPALYRLTFYYRYPGAGKGNIPGVAELSLDHPERIKAQLEAQERAKFAHAVGGGNPSFGGFGTVQRNPFGLPFIQGQPPAPQAGVPSGMSEKDIRELKNLSAEAAYLRGIMAGRTDAQAAPVAAAPVVPAYDPRLPPQGLSAEEWDSIQEARSSRGVAKAVAQTLTAMGFTPQLIQQAGQPQMQPITPPIAPVDPLSALEKAFEMFKSYANFQKKMTEALPAMIGGPPAAEAAEEDPLQMKPVGAGVTFPGSEAPMLYGPKMDDESHFEYFIRLGTANPMAAQSILGWAAKVLDPKTLNELIQAFAAKAGGKKVGAPPPPPAVQPKQMGWQASGGAPPAPVQTSSPQATPAPPPASGWTPRA